MTTTRITSRCQITRWPNTPQHTAKLITFRFGLQTEIFRGAAPVLIDAAPKFRQKHLATPRGTTSQAWSVFLLQLSRPLVHLCTTVADLRFCLQTDVASRIYRPPRVQVRRANYFSRTARKPITFAGSASAVSSGLATTARLPRLTVTSDAARS